MNLNLDNTLSKQERRSIYSSFNLDDINKSKCDAYSFCHENWWVWPKEKNFLHTIEEIGEYVSEIITGNKEAKNGNTWLDTLDNQFDELWDICFTYLTYIDEKDIKIEKHEFQPILKYVLSALKDLDYTNKDVLLLFLAELSKENKVARKLDGRKDNYKFTELDLKKSQILNLVCLHMLTRLYKSSISEVVQNSLDKYNWRDVKK